MEPGATPPNPLIYFFHISLVIAIVKKAIAKAKTEDTVLIADMFDDREEAKIALTAR